MKSKGQIMRGLVDFLKSLSFIQELYRVIHPFVWQILLSTCYIPGTVPGSGKYRSLKTKVKKNNKTITIITKIKN